MGRTTKLKRTPDEIARAIRDQILCGAMEPGTVARQDELAKHFSVSRVPVREALRSLVAEGLMTWEPQRGFKVARVAPEDAREILEIRSILEVQALRKGFDAITPEIIQSASAVLQRSEQTQSIDAWSELNGMFHAAILELANRPQLLSLIQHLNNRVDRYIRLLIAASDYRQRAEREHRAILAAIEVGNLEAAVSLLSQHIEDTAKRLDEFLASYRLWGASTEQRQRRPSR
ncbi:MAG: GntR family transcriptional regulator [Hyphomicrobiaceae bacterium]|nr:GntR family transcriptional regulator [Hyphomicrobiaceae bacterium]